MRIISAFSCCTLVAMGFIAKPTTHVTTTIHTVASPIMTTTTSIPTTTTTIATTTTTTSIPVTTTTTVPATTTTTAAVVTTTTAAVSHSIVNSCHGYRMSVAQAHACWDTLIDQYNWPTSTAFAVMYCESTGNDLAANDSSTAHSLFQILDGPYNPVANVALAYQMWKTRGWEPWLSSQTCWE